MTKKFEYKIEKVKKVKFTHSDDEEKNRHNQVDNDFEFYLDLMSLELDCLNKNGQDGWEFHSRSLYVLKVESKGKEEKAHLVSFTFKREIS